MVSNVQFAVGLALLLGIVDYLSEGHFTRRKWLFKERLVSFAAGLSVSYIFLNLFPQLYTTAHVIPRLIFVSMLVGFVAYHAIEKLIYQYARRDEIINDIELEHSITLFFYHFSIGIVFLSLMQQTVLDGVLFFVPVSLHVIINALPHCNQFRRRSVKAFFSSAPLLGVVTALVLPIPAVITALLLGVVAGILLFVEAREVVPRRRAESIVWFLIGVVVYGFLICASWVV